MMTGDKIEVQIETSSNVTGSDAQQEDNSLAQQQSVTSATNERNAANANANKSCCFCWCCCCSCSWYVLFIIHCLPITFIFHLIPFSTSFPIFIHLIILIVCLLVWFALNPKLIDFIDLKLLSETY